MIAAMAIVGGITMPFGIQFFNQQTLMGARGQFTEVIGKARMQSVNQKADSQYGIYVTATSTINGTSTNYILFKGAVYVPGDSNNEVYEAPYGISIFLPASTTNIVFAKRTGLASATGTITFRLENLTKTSIIDDFGNVREQ